jgi:hypothetical protein
MLPRMTIGTYDFQVVKVTVAPVPDGNLVMHMERLVSDMTSLAFIASHILDYSRHLAPLLGRPSWINISMATLWTRRPARPFLVWLTVPNIIAIEALPLNCPG